MSHFIISSNPTFIFGTPNGQASTQLLQAMHRGFRADWTTPSPVRLMASAGQTSAHVGEWQCMQTTGSVWVECARSMTSRWIIECPLWVSHSEQACTHAWQPMHRFGSMKKRWCSGTMTYSLSAEGYCCGSSRVTYSGGPSARRTRAAQTLYSGIFEIGSWAALVTWLMLFGPAQW